MIIFVILHDTYQNTNMFFTNQKKALNHIKKIVQDTGTKLEEWNIKIIVEGEFFHGNFLV